MHRDLLETKEGVSYVHLLIYLCVDECWLTSSIPQQRFKCQIVLMDAVNPENVVSEN